MKKRQIYLDNNATTFPLPTVIEAIVNALNAKEEGNPSSVHTFGQKARFRLSDARSRIAACLGVRPSEVIFTSSGTEGVAMLLRGMLQGSPHGHLITSNVEHACMISNIASLEKEGLACTYLEAGRWGAVTPEAVKKAIRPDTRLIALMAVNNETGVKTDVDAIAAIAADAKIPLMLDGVSWYGKEPVKIPAGVTAIAFSGHKFHAPKGIGFVFLRSTARFLPLLTGGGQEFGRRAGTENLPGIAGLAVAVESVNSDIPKLCGYIGELRDRLENELMSRLEGVTVNGLGPRVPNTTNLAFRGIEGEALLAALDLEGIAVSHGSACSSGALEPSGILLKMGCSKAEAASSVRFSLSRHTTSEEIESCIDTVVAIVNKLR
jgi:cysteine desulfurase